MKAKSLVLFAVAAAFGLVAMLGVMQIINSKPGKEPTVRVLVAAADIPSGMPLDETNVTFKEFPESTVPSGAVTKEEEYRGKAIVSRAVTGEIIMAAKLGGAESITASHQIPKGMRVATVSVNATKSHSGLIRPTDRVDVVCSYQVQDAVSRRNATHVKTVLDFIEVFAVDAVRAGREGEVDGAIKNVSLIVNPEQYQLLMAAEKMGELELALRNRADTEKTDVSELSDAIFYQQDTSAGTRVSVETPTGPVAGQPATEKANGLGDFLTAAMTAMSTNATQPAAAEGTPKWTMTICRGADIEDVEVLDEAALPWGLSASERQRVRAESRAAMPKRPVEPPKPAATTEPKTNEPKTNGEAPAGEKPATDKPAADKPAGLTPVAQPAGTAPAEPAPQAAATAATTPALVPFTPFGPFGN